MPQLICSFNGATVRHTWDTMDLCVWAYPATSGNIHCLLQASKLARGWTRAILAECDGMEVRKEVANFAAVLLPLSLSLGFTILQCILMRSFPFE